MAETPYRPQPDSPMSDILAYYNQNFDLIDSQDRTKIIKNSGIPVLLLGYLKSGFNGKDYGLKIAKDGIDVTTATDDQLVFNSGFDMLKVRLSGAHSIVVPGVGAGAYGAHVTIPHGLSYVPAVLGFVKVGRDDELIGDFWFPAIPAPGGNEQQSVAADATNIYLVVIVADITAWYNYSFDFRYYVLQETVA